MKFEGVDEYNKQHPLAYDAFIGDCSILKRSLHQIGTYESLLQMGVSILPVGVPNMLSCFEFDSTVKL